MHGDMPYSVTIDELPVYSDVRRATRAHCGELTLTKWAGNPTHGFLARCQDKIWAPSRDYCSSRPSVALPGYCVPSSFFLRLRQLCLRTPTQVARNNKDELAARLDVDESGDGTCYLCAEMGEVPARGDTQHLLLSCPALHNARSDTRYLLGAALRGVGPPGWWAPRGGNRAKDVSLHCALAGLHRQPAASTEELLTPNDATPPGCVLLNWLQLGTISTAIPEDMLGPTLQYAYKPDCSVFCVTDIGRAHALVNAGHPVSLRCGIPAGR